MGENTIELEEVSKRYFLGQHHGMGVTLRSVIHDAVRRRGRRALKDEIWPLRDINLEVGEGEVLGVVGRNGAGKSTLLKVVCRITEPTSGVSRTRGRVGALLEVGTGFHVELTGRENVFLSGAILGMGRRQIQRRLDDIVSFANVEPFMDTPMKRFSTGMQLRLGFAVAAHLDAEILIIDEVLAVGDTEFQRKCLARMEDVKRSGRTILFVSHNLDAVLRLCPNSIWLEGGRIVASGRSRDVIDQYLVSGLQRGDVITFPEQPEAATQLDSVAVIGQDGRPASLLRRDQPFTVEVSFELREAPPNLDFSVVIQNVIGLRILDHAWSDNTQAPFGGPGRYRASLTIPPILHAGDYRLSIWIGTVYETLVWEEVPYTFRLEGGDQGRPERVLNLPLGWDVQRVL